MRVQGIALKCVITIEVILYKYSRQKPGPHQKQPQSKITTMLVHIIDISWNSWAEAPIKIARMILTIKLDGNWSSFQLANSAPPLSVTDSAIAPSARMHALSLHAQVYDCRLPLLGCCSILLGGMRAPLTRRRALVQQQRLHIEPACRRCSSML